MIYIETFPHVLRKDREISIKVFNGIEGFYLKIESNALFDNAKRIILSENKVLSMKYKFSKSKDYLIIDDKNYIHIFSIGSATVKFLGKIKICGTLGKKHSKFIKFNNRENILFIMSDKLESTFVKILPKELGKTWKYSFDKKVYYIKFLMHTNDLIVVFEDKSVKILQIDKVSREKKNYAIILKASEKINHPFFNSCNRDVLNLIENYLSEGFQ